MAHQLGTSIVIGRVGIVGLGLIGGSFARALAKDNREVYAWNRTRSTLELACIETLTGELTDKIIATCELIILAGYPAQAVEWLTEHATQISTGAIVIDAVGVKREICEQCEDIASKHDFIFVGCHPMAGTQFSGFAHSRSSLFRGAPLVVVPPALPDLERADVLDRLHRLLEPCGFASMTLSTAEEHDRRIAYTSQLAHVVSNAYVKSPTAQGHHGFSAGSYRDLTRVARLNAPMWTELFLANADFLEAEIDHLINALTEYQDALHNKDAARLEELLAEGDRLKREAEEQS